MLLKNLCKSAFICVQLQFLGVTRKVNGLSRLTLLRNFAWIDDYIVIFKVIPAKAGIYSITL